MNIEVNKKILSSFSVIIIVIPKFIQVTKSLLN